MLLLSAIDHDLPPADNKNNYLSYSIDSPNESHDLDVGQIMKILMSTHLDKQHYAVSLVVRSGIFSKF